MKIEKLNVLRKIIIFNRKLNIIEINFYLK